MSLTMHVYSLFYIDITLWLARVGPVIINYRRRWSDRRPRKTVTSHLAREFRKALVNVSVTIQLPRSQKSFSSVVPQLITSAAAAEKMDGV